MKNNLFKDGFSMAEAVFALVVIGLISMYAFSTVVNDVGKKKFKTMFDKNLSAFSGALYEYNGDLDNVNDNATDFENNFLNKYFNVLTFAEDTDLQEAYTDGEYYSYSNIIGNGTYTLSDGTNAICFKNTDTGLKIGADSTLRLNENGQRVTKEHIVKIICVLDLNGKKGPNKAGEDLRLIFLADEKAKGLESETESD